MVLSRPEFCIEARDRLASFLGVRQNARRKTDVKVGNLCGNGGLILTGLAQCGSQVGAPAAPSVGMPQVRVSCPMAVPELTDDTCSSYHHLGS